MVLDPEVAPLDPPLLDGLNPVPVDGLYLALEVWGAFPALSPAFVPVRLEGAAGAPVDEPWTTPDVFVCACPAPAPVSSIGFTVVSPVLLLTLGSSLFSSFQLCGPQLELSGFVTDAVKPG